MGTHGQRAHEHGGLAASVTLQPRLSKVDDSHPPPMLPTSATR